MISLPSVTTINKLHGIYFAFYAVGLYFAPLSFFGPDGILPYWVGQTELDPLTNYFARALGGVALALTVGCWTDADSLVVTKMFSTFWIVLTPLWLKNIQDDSGQFLKKNWVRFVLTDVPLMALAFSAVFKAKIKKE